MQIDYAYGDRVTVSGDTYKRREIIKSFGLRWDGSRKVWHGTLTDGEYGLDILSRVGLTVTPHGEAIPVSNHTSPAGSGDHYPCRRCGTYCQSDGACSS